MARRRFRPIRWIQRAILGMMMTVVAFVVERRLLKALRKSGQKVRGVDEPVTDAEDADLFSGYDRAPAD